jgi:DNA mismatch repair protein MLH1
MEYSYSDRDPIHCRLTTVKELRAEVRSTMHNDLTEVFASHTFVGIVDERRRIAAIQAGVKLFLVDYGMISNEYFYQLGLTDFGNFGSIRLTPSQSQSSPRSCRRLREGHQHYTSPFDWTEYLILSAASSSSGVRCWLNISRSKSTPMACCTASPARQGYMPSLAKLPRLLLGWARM